MLLQILLQSSNLIILSLNLLLKVFFNLLQIHIFSLNPTDHSIHISDCVLMLFAECI